MCDESSLSEKSVYDQIKSMTEQIHILTDKVHKIEGTNLAIKQYRDLYNRIEHSEQQKKESVMCDMNTVKHIENLEKRISALESDRNLDKIANNLQKQKEDCAKYHEDLCNSPIHAMQSRFNCAIENISFHIGEGYPLWTVEILLAVGTDIKVLRERKFILYDYMEAICKELFKSSVFRDLCGGQTDIKVMIKKGCDDDAIVQLLEQFIVNL